MNTETHHVFVVKAQLVDSVLKMACRTAFIALVPVEFTEDVDVTSMTD